MMNIKQRGFTLIEIIVYIAVLAIIVLVVFSFFSWLNSSNIRVNSTRETLDNSRRAMEQIGYEVKEANSVYTPTTVSDQLSLGTAHYLPEGENKTYIDFFLCGTRLCLKKEGKDPIALTSELVELKNLRFISVATSSVQVNLGLVYKTSSLKPEFQAVVNTTSTFSIRL